MSATLTARATWRDRLRDWIEGPRPQRFVTALIVVNAVTLGMETSPVLMAAAGPLLVALDTAILSVFVVEIALRVTARGLGFFRDPWSVFDFAVVAIALVPSSGPFAVLRALRILRVLRLLSIVPSMRRVVSALLASIPGIGSIAVILLILFYGDCDQPVRTSLSGVVRLGWPLHVHSVPGNDPGELVDGHCPAGDGEIPLRLGVLHSLHPDCHLHHAEPVHRRDR
jgi:hypothetical protein